MLCRSAVSPFLLICSYYFPFITSTTPPHRGVALHLDPGAKTLHYIFNVVCNYFAALDTFRASERCRSSENLVCAPWALCLKQAPSHPTWVRNTISRERFVYLRAGTAARCVAEWCGKNISCLWHYLLACSGWQCSRFASAHSFHHLFFDFLFHCKTPQCHIAPHGVFMPLRL